ncbi:hypothetical protein EUGRSUZ_L02878 [Eucalyptus grandis]|uniref:Uncharacterized protein n=1 Tax=Eucalyptus grandis TaxID=71139 RepID=A0AAD9T8F4_EUCGR|nr:hypothetical protein EUGRSUZ_L02878 [Eucalyptus grandis]
MGGAEEEGVTPPVKTDEYDDMDATPRVDAPTGDMQGKSDETVDKLDASIPEPVKKTQEATKERTSKNSTSRNSLKDKSRKSSKGKSRRERITRNDTKTDNKPSRGFAQKRNGNHDRSLEITAVLRRHRASSSSGTPATSSSLTATNPTASSTPLTLALRSSPPTTSQGGLGSHDIESGSPQGESTHAHSLDHVRSQQRFAIPHASLFELNLVAGGLLIDGLLWKLKDTVRYVLIFLFLLGFFGFLIGESIRSPRIRATGSVATFFAFIMTMLLFIMHAT